MSALNDLTGKRFGRLVVQRRVASDHRQESRFACMCDCGNTRVVSRQSLQRGHTLSCGCFKAPNRKPAHPVSRATNLRGKIFGSWQVLARAPSRDGRRAMWECICSCGTKREVFAEALTRGQSKSCGCQNRPPPRPPKERPVEQPRKTIDERFKETFSADPHKLMERLGLL